MSRGLTKDEWKILWAILWRLLVFGPILMTLGLAMFGVVMAFLLCPPVLAAIDFFTGSIWLGLLILGVWFAAVWFSRKWLRKFFKEFEGIGEL
jgi:hypothetical protein